jgi:hypothetical protein
MAAGASMHEYSVTGATRREVAINKTRHLAFARTGEAEEWQPIALQDVAGVAARKGEGHVKIGDHWFAVYKVEAGQG